MEHFFENLGTPNHFANFSKVSIFLEIDGDKSASNNAKGSVVDQI